MPISHQNLLDFGRQPVAGYLCVSHDDSLNQPRVPHGLSIDPITSLVHQTYLDGRDLLSSKVYRDYQSTYNSSATLNTYMSSFISHVVSRCQLAPGDNVLEVGSNNGAVLAHLSRSGYRCIGIDPTSPIIEEPNLTLHNCCFDVDLVSQLSLFGKFKCIFSRHTFEHVYDPLNFLQAASLALHDQGKVFIEVPYLPMQIKRNHFEGMQVQHESFFTLTSLSNLISAVHLVIEDFHFVGLDGGSIVVTLSRSTQSNLLPSYLDLENLQGFSDGSAVQNYGEQLARAVLSFTNLLKSIRERGHSLFAYGAGSKGAFICNFLNLANYAELVLDDVQVEDNPMYIPGSGLKVVNPRHHPVLSPDFILITAPTLFAEVSRRAKSLYPQATLLTTTPLMGISESISS
jgi:SAM-dependent methyltransferase